jgi:hypothetical protein
MQLQSHVSQVARGILRSKVVAVYIGSRYADVFQIVSRHGREGSEDDFIPMAMNEYVFNGNLLQLDAEYGIHPFGKYNYIDISKVYETPVELIDKEHYGSLKLCRSSREMVRGKMSVGTLLEERQDLEREFQRYQIQSRIQSRNSQVLKDYEIRTGLNPWAYPPPPKHLKVLRPRLRRSEGRI